MSCPLRLSDLAPPEAAVPAREYPRAMRPKPRVAMLVYPGIGPFELTGPLLILGPNGLTESPVDLILFSLVPPPICTAVHSTLHAVQDLNVLETADVILIPGWPSLDHPVPERLIGALQRAHQRRARLVGLCLGVFVLAEAGVLDGGEATTHWLLSPAFIQRFPAVRLVPEVLYRCASRVLTSAGGLAAIDTCLHLLHELDSATRAEEVARWIVSAPQRAGDQAQWLAQPLITSDRHRRLLQQMDWVRHHLAEPHRVSDLAAALGMSPRTFTRHFREITGTSFSPWLRMLRLQYAQKLLETTRQSLEIIASLSGFSSAATLRKQFRSVLGVSPSAWRKAHRQASDSERRKKRSTLDLD